MINYFDNFTLINLNAFFVRNIDINQYYKKDIENYIKNLHSFM